MNLALRPITEGLAFCRNQGNVHILLRNLTASTSTSLTVRPSVRSRSAKKFEKYLIRLGLDFVLQLAFVINAINLCQTKKISSP